MKIVSAMRLVKGAGALMLAGLSFAANASVSLTGNTFSWPYDGWYVVQNTLTQEIVCEGGTGCTVPDGEYWITRHNFSGGGEGVGRFRVGDVPSYTQQQFEDSIVVNGTTLTFSIPGWYQVQTTDTYEEVCSGFDSCTVPTPGEYQITNHGAGKMKAVLMVGMVNPVQPVDPIDPTNPVQSDINVSGSIISWPDNGWYQVQRADNYATVCQGGRQCSVSPGVYHVINLTSGERFENIRVDSEQLPTINVSNYEGLIRQAFQVFSGQWFSNRVVEYPYLRGAYANSTEICANGGTHDQSRTPLRTGTVVIESLSDNCQFQFGGLGSGDTIDGNFVDYNSPIGHQHRFDNFSISFRNGDSLTADGVYWTAVGGDGASVDLIDFNYYFSGNGGSVTVSEANTLLSRPFRLHSSTGSLSGSFLFRGDVVNQNEVTVTVDTPFTYDDTDALSLGIDPSAFMDEQTRNSLLFSEGVLRIESANDGSAVVLNADTGNINTVYIEISNSVAITTGELNWSEWAASLQGNMTRDYRQR